jgi:hypothetical protein
LFTIRNFFMIRGFVIRNPVEDGRPTSLYTKRLSRRFLQLGTKACWSGENFQSILSDPGCLSRIPNPDFSIPGPRSWVKKALDPGSGSAANNLSIFKPKNFYQPLGNIWSRMSIQEPESRFFPIPYLGVKKELPLDPGSTTLVLHSVANPDPDPYVFGPPGSGSVSQRYGSGSLYHQVKIVRKTLIPTVLWLFLLLFNFEKRCKWTFKK